MTGECRRCGCHRRDLQMAGWCLECVRTSVTSGANSACETALLPMWVHSVDAPGALERLATVDVEDDRRIIAWEARRRAA